MKTEPPLPPALQRALELREEGKSQRAIAEILAAESAPFPPGRYKKWNQMAGGRMFQRDGPGEPPALATADVDELAAERQRWKELLASQAGQNEEWARLLEREEQSETRRRRRRREEWSGRRPVLLAGLLLGLVLGASGAWLYHTFGPPGQELSRYQRAWNAMTEEQRQAVNRQLQASGWRRPPQGRFICPPGDSYHPL